MQIDINNIKYKILRSELLPDLPEQLTRILQKSTALLHLESDFRQMAESDARMAQLMHSIWNNSSHTNTQDAHARLCSILFLWTLPRLFSKKTKNPLSLEKLWEHAIATSQYSARLAEKIPCIDVEEARMAGFLHDIGKIALDCIAPEGYQLISPFGNNPGSQTLETERLAFGIDHALAGKWLAERWSLPKKWVTAIWLHHQAVDSLIDGPFPTTLIDVTALADLLAHIEDSETLGEHQFQRTSRERAKRLGWTINKLLHLVQETRQSKKNENVTLDQLLLSGDLQELASHNTLTLSLQDTQRRSIQALQSLQELHTSSTDNVEMISVLATAIRKVFAMESGVCFLVETETGTLSGCQWHGTDAPLESVWMQVPRNEAANDLKDNAASTLAPDTLLRAFFQNNHNSTQAASTAPISVADWISLPLPLGESYWGRFLGRSANPAAWNLETMQELIRLLHAAGNIVHHNNQLTVERNRSEILAQALYGQEQKYRQQLKRERMTAIGKMAAGAAHEINNPLAVIAGRAQLLLSRLHDSDDLHSLETIIQHARRAGKVLMDLMQFAQPPEPKLEPTLISFVLHHVALSFKERLSEKNIRVIEEYSQSLPRVRLDRSLMERLFINLIVNAERAMAKNGGILTLRARTTRDRKSVLAQVVDTGTGIPGEVIDHIFEPFFSHHKQGDGTGLGLAVCQGIVESHRGAISVHSIEGHGATFTITLPTVADEEISEVQSEDSDESTKTHFEETEHSRNTPQPSPAKHPVILLAETDEALQEVLKDTFENRGYQVLALADGLEVMAALLANPVELVLMNLEMQGVDSALLVADVCKREQPDRIIGITSGDNYKVIELAQKLGVRTIISKPFEVQRLLAEVERHMAARRVA